MGLRQGGLTAGPLRAASYCLLRKCFLLCSCVRLKSTFPKWNFPKENSRFPIPHPQVKPLFSSGACAPRVSFSSPSEGVRCS